MWQHQGNPTAQLQVLQQNPKGKHCELWQVQSTACRSCPKNPWQVKNQRLDDLVQEWGFEIRRAQDMIRRQRAGIVFQERDLLLFESELAVAACEVVQEREADEWLKRQKVNELSPQQREQRRRIASRGKLQHQGNR